MKVILFFAGLGKPGGISPDVWHLAAALREEDVPLTVTSSFRDVLTSKRGKGTVVHVFGCLPSAANIGVMLIARLRGQRLIWTPTFHPRRVSMWKGSGLYRLMVLFDRTAPRLARITHAVSAATAEEASFFEAMGAPRAEVIPLAVGELHPRLEGEDREKTREHLGIGDEPVALLIAAHSPRRKGMDFAAEVLAELRSQQPDATFLLVGGGDLGALANQPGVKSLGWCSEEDLLAAYRCADILFVPSLYEQFSRATIEAWACELPVVLTEGVGLASLTESSGAGMVVPFRDVPTTVSALAQALGDPIWRLSAGQLGRALVQKNFLRDHYLGATLTLYRSVS
jgi:glycosyltransferase involved in cell wall biosynthesis